MAHALRRWQKRVGLAAGLGLLIVGQSLAVGTPAAHKARAFPGVGKPGAELVDAVVLTPQAQFDTGDHSALFKDLAQQGCTRILAQAQWGQDIVHVGESAAHFDNCALEPSLKHVQDRLKDVDAKVVAARASAAGAAADLDAALWELGRATHGIQDFYSHSNFLEQGLAANASQSELSQLDFWSPEQHDALLQRWSAAHVVSGVWYEDHPDGCPAPALTHARLNKDSNASEEGRVVPAAAWANGRSQHQVALELARDATVRLLQYSFKRWPESSASAAAGRLASPWPSTSARNEPARLRRRAGARGARRGAPGPGRGRASPARLDGDPALVRAVAALGRLVLDGAQAVARCQSAGEGRTFGSGGTTIEILPAPPEPAFRAVAVNAPDAGVAGAGALRIDLVKDATAPGLSRPDALTVTGLCEATPPDAVRCSADALRAMLAADPRGRPVFFTLAHELRHLLKHDQAYAYQPVEAVDCAMGRRAKIFALTSRACTPRPEQVRREEDADAFATWVWSVTPELGGAFGASLDLRWRPAPGASAARDSCPSVVRAGGRGEAAGPLDLQLDPDFYLLASSLELFPPDATAAADAGSDVIFGGADPLGSPPECSVEREGLEAALALEQALERWHAHLGFHDARRDPDGLLRSILPRVRRGVLPGGRERPPGPGHPPARAGEGLRRAGLRGAAAERRRRGA